MDLFRSGTPLFGTDLEKENKTKQGVNGRVTVSQDSQVLFLLLQNLCKQP